MRLGFGYRHGGTSWRSGIRWLARLVAAALLVAPACASPPSCQLVIGSCHQPPLSDSSGTGIIDRLVIEAFRRIGYEACVTPLACERSLRNADNGVTDGDLLRIPSAVAASAPNLVAVPEPLYRVAMHGFTLDPALRIGGLDDLSRLRVGYILGWKILEDRVRAADTLRVRGPEELFALLSHKKADLIIYERLTGIRFAKDMELAGIRVLEPPLVDLPQHLMLHHRHRHLVESLASALRAMKAEGAYAAAFVAAGYALP